MSKNKKMRRTRRDEQIERQGKTVFNWIVGAMIILAIVLIAVFVNSAS